MWRCRGCSLKQVGLKATWNLRLGSLLFLRRLKIGKLLSMKRGRRDRKIIVLCLDRTPFLLRRRIRKLHPIKRGRSDWKIIHNIVRYLGRTLFLRLQRPKIRKLHPIKRRGNREVILHRITNQGIILRLGAMGMSGTCAIKIAGGVGDAYWWSIRQLLSWISELGLDSSTRFLRHPFVQMNIQRKYQCTVRFTPTFTHEKHQGSFQLDHEQISLFVTYNLHRHRRHFKEVNINEVISLAKKLFVNEHHNSNLSQNYDETRNWKHALKYLYLCRTSRNFFSRLSMYIHLLMNQRLSSFMNNFRKTTNIRLGRHEQGECAVGWCVPVGGRKRRMCLCLSRPGERIQAVAGQRRWEYSKS